MHLLLVENRLCTHLTPHGVTVIAGGPFVKSIELAFLTYTRISYPFSSESLILFQRCLSLKGGVVGHGAPPGLHIELSVCQGLHTRRCVDHVCRTNARGVNTKVAGAVPGPQLTFTFGAVMVSACIREAMCTLCASVNDMHS